MQATSKPLRFGRTLTLSELARRSRQPGLYVPTPAGVRRALADMTRVTPCARFLLGLEAMDAVREVREQA